MSTGLKRTWRNGDRWNTLAYTYFRDSREWRYLLALNPSYDIRYFPATGVEIQVSGSLGEGKSTPGGAATPGRLKQVDTNLDLRVSPTIGPGDGNEGIFPWSTFADYSNRLGEYTAAGLMGTERTNGFSLDSPQAVVDTQRG